MRTIAALLAILPVVVVTQSVAAESTDAPVLTALSRGSNKHEAPHLLYRRSVAGGVDLVIGFASPRVQTDLSQLPGVPNIGLFLQERAHPERVQTIVVAVADCPDACYPRVERSTTTDTVISWHPEKGPWTLNQRFVYDLVKKALVSQSSYSRIVINGVLHDQKNTLFLARDSRRTITIRYKPGQDPEFRILNPREAVMQSHLFVMPAVEDVQFGPQGAFSIRKLDETGSTQISIEERRGTQVVRHRVPVSTYVAFAKARPRRVSEGYTASARMNETIGPWQISGDRLWFGKTFYDSEGFTGVGGFGYFDPTEKQFHLFAPREIANWSVSAIDVMDDATWLGLIHRGEWGDSSGGILRYDRRTGATKQFTLGESDLVRQFARVGNGIVAATEFGVATIDGGEVRRYFLDRSADGQLHVVEVSK